VKVVFLDRDGVINKRIVGGYVKKWEEFEFLPGAIAAIKLLNEKKVPVILISNQSGIGRGYMAQDDLKEIHKRMSVELAKEGAHIDDIFVCPHSPDDNCGCRKPKTGLFEQAKKKYKDIDIKSSWFIGDSETDMQAGNNIGCRTYLVKENEGFMAEVKKILKELK